MSTINSITSDTKMGPSPYVEEVAVSKKPVPTPNSRDTITSLSSSEVRAAAEAEAAAQIEANRKKATDQLKAELNRLTAEFDNLPWYSKVFYSVYYGAKILQINVCIQLVSDAAKNAMAEMKKGIDDFLIEFEKAGAGGNPDKQTSNPFDPDAPKITPGLPTIGRHGASPGGGGSVSLTEWIKNSVVLVFGNLIPNAFRAMGF